MTGLERLLADPRFADSEKRQQHAAELVQILDRRFAEEPRHVWENRLRQAPDLVFDRVQKIGELKDDPAVIANGYLKDIDHPRYGRVKVVQPPVNLSATPAEIQRMSPELGEHTLEILGELGLDDEAAAQLFVDEVVG